MNPLHVVSALVVTRVTRDDLINNDKQNEMSFVTETQTKIVIS